MRSRLKVTYKALTVNHIVRKQIFKIYFIKRRFPYQCYKTGISLYNRQVFVDANSFIAYYMHLLLYNEAQLL
jgi:hypothetical protein